MSSRADPLVGDCFICINSRNQVGCVLFIAQLLNFASGGGDTEAIDLHIFVKTWVTRSAKATLA